MMYMYIVREREKEKENEKSEFYSEDSCYLCLLRLANSGMFSYVYEIILRGPAGDLKPILLVTVSRFSGQSLYQLNVLKKQ